MTRATTADPTTLAVEALVQIGQATQCIAEAMRPRRSKSGMSADFSRAQTALTTAVELIAAAHAAPPFNANPLEAP